jgi:CheY-like chemotaxis protein
MDHIMPEVDGITATKTLREMGYTAPIIALTANRFGKETKYLGKGFDAFLSKPIMPEEFDAILHRFVRDKQPQHVLDAVVAKAKCKRVKADNKTGTCEVTEKLRADFARKQKDVYTDITIALGSGNSETAHWHIDTIKNMAGMINEPVLAKIAADIGTAIENGEIPTRLLEMLNQELTTVLAAIPEEEGTETPPLKAAEIHTLLKDVYNLLEADNAEIVFSVKKLRLVPDSDDLIHHIENFDFPKAIEALEILQKNAEV